MKHITSTLKTLLPELAPFAEAFERDLEALEQQYQTERQQSEAERAKRRAAFERRRARLFCRMEGQL